MPSARRVGNYPSVSRQFRGVNAQSPARNKIQTTALPSCEAATRRSLRRLSRIAKGPLDPLFKNERSRG
jgi:hypothetical protein